MHHLRTHLYLALGVSLCASALAQSASTGENTDGNNLLRRLNLETQPKVVKIFGVGGLRQLEAFQTGVFVSPEGHILTTQSLVLDEGEVTVVLWNGTRATGSVVAVDPVLEIAILKIQLDEPVAFFSLDDEVEVEPGMRILALTNLFGIAVYDEPVSVLHGVVTSIAPLSARRGAFEANYSGTVYIIDAATNNPGAAGGAIIDLSGQLVGLIGKELRSEATGTWLNYALPVDLLREPVDRLRSGVSTPRVNSLDREEDFLTLGDLGIVLVPNIVDRTPPYVERVLAGSAAGKAGLRADDLIVAVGTQPIASQRDLSIQISRSDPRRPLQLTLLRGRDLVRVALEHLKLQAERDE